MTHYEKMIATIKEGRKRRNEKMLRLYIDDNLTLNEVGKIYGVTRERVRQILKHSLEYKQLRNKENV